MIPLLPQACSSEKVRKLVTKVAGIVVALEQIKCFRGWFPGSAKAEVHDCVIGELRAVIQLYDKWQSSPCIGGHFTEP